MTTLHGRACLGWSWVVCLLPCLLLSLVTGLLIGAAVGCTKRAASPTERQQRALDALSGREWFDADQLAYRPPPVSRDLDDPVRTKGWLAPPTTAAPPRAGGGTAWTGFGEGMTILVWTILIVTLVGLALLLAMFSMRSWNRAQVKTKRNASITIDPARVVDLPFESVQVTNDPLAQARQLAAARDFDNAVLCLYAYMLLALDRAGQIVLHRGKTNRMYLFELGSHTPLGQLLWPAMLAFEDVFFGRHSIAEARFKQLWDNLDQFHAHLTPLIQTQLAESAEKAMATSGAISSAASTGAAHKVARLWLLLCGLSAVAGCSSAPVETQYGASQFPSANTSLNGLGVFEKLCSQSGVRTMQVRRLSPRLRRTDHLLLVGDTFSPPAKEARDWIEQWLAEQPGRTAIYFGRDFGAESYLYDETLAQQTADQKRRAQLDLAQLQADLDRRLYAEVEDDIFCRWFVLRASRPQRWLTSFTGPLSQTMGSSARWPVRTYLDTPDSTSESAKPTWNTTTLAPAPRFPNRSRQNANAQRESSVYNSVWSYGDINDDATWKSEWKKVPKTTVLLAGDDGTPLVTELTSPLYPGSRILLLANGAPLFNATLVAAPFRELAMHLISQFAEGSRLAILSFGTSGIQISDVPEADEQATGLSALATWPLNMIMAHLALLGILICLALFPIYGRPQDLPATAVSDFGQHAEALGQWLSRTGDSQLAAQLTADYLRIVRGESPPQWLQSASTDRDATDDSSSSSHLPYQH